MTPAALLAAWLLHTMAVASPGPAVLMTARVGVTQGFGAGAWLALGIGVGATVWAVAALFGLALLFEVAPALLWGFKVAGGLYLGWIALQMWRHAAEPLPEGAPGGAADGAGRGAAWAALRLGILTQLSNPKPAIFFGAVFVGTLPPGTTWPWMVGLLGMILVNEALIMILFARLFSLEGPRAAYRRLKTGIDRTFGGLLALLGARIALT